MPERRPTRAQEMGDTPVNLGELVEEIKRSNSELVKILEEILAEEKEQTKSMREVEDALGRPSD